MPAAKPITKYWAERYARWEGEMSEIIAKGREMTRIRRSPLTPYLVPFVPSLAEGSSLVFKLKRGRKTIATRELRRDIERIQQEGDRIVVAWK
jgi:hypothetical protein